MQHDQFIIQSDAQKTFDTIMKGPRVFENKERPDALIDWLERTEENQNELNLLFREMR